MIAAADLAEKAFRNVSAREAERFFDPEFMCGFAMAYVLNRWPEVLRPLRALEGRAQRQSLREARHQSSPLRLTGAAIPAAALAAGAGESSQRLT